MLQLKMLTIFLLSLIMSAYTQADSNAQKPLEITAKEAANLAKKQGESKAFSKTKLGNLWSIYESNINTTSYDFSDSVRCYWRITVQNEKVQKQVILHEKGGYCDRSYILEFEPMLLDKNILIMDLPSERGGIFYIFYLTQDDIRWIAQRYMSLDDDGLIIKKRGDVIYANTLTDKYQVYLDKQQKLIVKKR